MRKPVFLLGGLAVLAAALLAGLFGAADDARAITAQQVIITVDTASDSPS